MIRQRFPAGPAVTADELLAEAATERLGFGDERVREFLGGLSRRLLALSRRHPELGALGFFLRPGEISRTLDRLEDADGTLRFPRGLVFHIPPANVDTVFVYSWALSALAGNANVVRLSQRGGEASTAILDALLETPADPVIHRTQRIVSYERSDEVTGALSAGCDLRVIWGGDQAVNAIRRHPLRPSARDLTFPDRSSFAAVSVPDWQAADAPAKRAAAEAFANDAYWFDQAACSSPRTIFWVGGDPATARAEFDELLVEAVTALGFAIDPAMAVEKRVSAYGLAAEGDVTAVRFHGNALATLDLADPALLPRRWLGAGTFAHAAVTSLADLVPLIRRADQTMTVFGFDAPALRSFAREVQGRGVDRIVPFGRALAFASTWDGYDLLREFTRLTTIRTNSTTQSDVPR